MVSVAMASYNGEIYIKKQIESILKNLGKNDELIISDDGSSDSTIEIIRSFGDSRIKLIEGPHNGLVKNFENAVKHCTGDIIFLCDQDDVWYDDKVKKVCDMFAKTNHILIEHNAIVKDGNGNVLFPSFFAHRRVRTGVLKNMIRNTYHGCLIAFRAELKDAMFPFPEKGCLHDQWIGLVAEMNGTTMFFDKILMDYRRHSGNASSFEHLPVFRQITDRIALTWNVMKYKINKRRKKKTSG